MAKREFAALGHTIVKSVLGETGISPTQTRIASAGGPLLYRILSPCDEVAGLRFFGRKTMRIADLVRPAPKTPYGRVPFEQPPFVFPASPCAGKRPPSAQPAPEALFLDTFETGEISAFCAEYRARLISSPIVTKNKQGKPSTRTSANDKAVLKALCLLMEKEKSTCFSAPEVAVASLVHCAENTAGDSIRRLVNAGYVIRHRLRAHGCAATYTLVIEKLNVLPDDAPRSLDGLTEIDAVKTGDLRDEAFHARNLGRATLEVYEQLLKMEPSRVRDIAAAIQKGESNVSAHLKKLATLKMAERDGWLWSAVKTRVKRDEDLHQITHKMGLIRSDLRAAHEIRRAQLLERLREDLEYLTSDEAREDGYDDDQLKELVKGVREEIRDVRAESAKYQRKTAWQKRNWDEFKAHAQNRFHAYLERAGVTEAQAVNDATGDREAGRVPPSAVAVWLRLQQRLVINAEHENIEK